mgnify:FL=1
MNRWIQGIIEEVAEEVIQGKQWWLLDLLLKIENPIYDVLNFRRLRHIGITFALDLSQELLQMACGHVRLVLRVLSEEIYHFGGRREVHFELVT